MIIRHPIYTVVVTAIGLAFTVPNLIAMAALVVAIVGSELQVRASTFEVVAEPHRRAVLDLLVDHVDGGHVGDVIADVLRRNAVDLDTLSAQAGTYAAKYGIRGRNGRALPASLLSQASEGDTHRRNEMATLLPGLDHRQQQILLELAATAGTALHTRRQPETGHQDR